MQYLFSIDKLILRKKKSCLASNQIYMGEFNKGAKEFTEINFPALEYAHTNIRIYPKDDYFFN
jgi:hypothetical protein